MISKIPSQIRCEFQNNLVKLTFNNLSTGWMRDDDSFIKRVNEDNLNSVFLKPHLIKEFEIKNRLDDGIRFLKSEKYSKAVQKFNEVLFYDSQYGEALLNKSFSLKFQKHFVKSLRYYKCAVSADENLKDMEYHKTLLKEANAEIDNFPKLKMNIYAGDQYFSKGDYNNAVLSYNRALANPSGFKDKILFKLLNKKATSLLNLNNFDEALTYFKKSLMVKVNDYAIFGQGLCEYNLGLEISDNFKNMLNINKIQMLRQAVILNDLGNFRESLKISDYLCRNHFKMDEFYLKLINARKYTMSELDMDLSKLNMVLDNFVER